MRGPRGQTTKAYLVLAVAIAGIAWSAIFVRWAGIPGSASAFYRVLVAGAVLLPWRLVRGGTRPVERLMKEPPPPTHGKRKGGGSTSQDR
jgi:hypothetical protein